jgi:hypothetical protein
VISGGIDGDLRIPGLDIEPEDSPQLAQG